MMLEQQED